MMINMKKLAAAVMVGVMAAVTVPAVTSVTAGTAYAAKGGAKLGGGVKSAPKAAAPKAAAPSSNNSKSVSGNGEGYKPSKDAKSLEKNAPAASSKAAAGNAANAQSGSRWGSALRNIGLFAGGMMLGSMLSHLFGGLGGGMMADILGLVMNILMAAAVFLILRWAWNKFRGRGKKTNVYRAPRMDSRPQEPLNVTPHSTSQQRMEIHDIKGPDDGYEAKSTADKYRSR